jgi:hypothetical protein
VRGEKFEFLVVLSVGVPQKNDRFTPGGKLVNERPDYGNYFPGLLTAIEGTRRIEKII